LTILDNLKRRALELSRKYTNEYFFIRGLWRFDLLFQPSLHERIFSYTVILAQCVGQGCCYTYENPVLDRELIGKDAREIVPKYKSLEIAILDAMYSTFEKNPTTRFVLDGSSIQKSVKRTEIVVEQVLKALKQKKCIEKRPRIVNVGAVGNFIRELRKSNTEVFATDCDPMMIGKEIHGVTVENSDKTMDFVEESDLALITGMTLSTGTLDQILKVANKYGTTVVMFAETGANFAEEYCKYGIDVVISEPFPFYIFQGRSIIDIYARKNEKKS